MSRILTWLVFAACWLPVAGGANESPAKGKLLVATELVRGDIFMQSVVLLLHYDETGAMGLVINRPTEVGMDELVVDDDAISSYGGQIYWGGPVQMNSLRALMQLANDGSFGTLQQIEQQIVNLRFDRQRFSIANDLATRGDDFKF